MYFNRKERTLIVTMAANFGLILLKFGLAWISGSLALRAGAWHSFSDIFISGIVFTGLLLARKEDVERSRGVSRIENIVAFVVGLFILYVGYDIFVEVIKGEQNGLTNVPFVIGGAILTIIISFFMARYKIFVGRETNSPSLIADGFHSKLDMYSSIVVVVGLVGYQIGVTEMDRVAAVIVVVLVAWAGLEIILSSLRALKTGGVPDNFHNNHFWHYTSTVAPFIPIIGIPLLLSLYCASGIYTVRWDQVGIEKRFGKPITAEMKPGLHYRLPWPFSSVDLVEVGKARKADTQNSLMLTGDENLIEVGATVHFFIADAFTYTYNITDPQQVVTLAVESALRNVVSRLSVDTILTDGKDAVQSETMAEAQAVLDKLVTGVRLSTVQLVRAAPPSGVLPAFQDVASAKEDQETYLNEAYSYKNEIIPESRGQSAEIIARAQAYAHAKIADSRGQAESFNERLLAFNESSDITRTRLYLETMEQVLTGADKMIVDKRIDIKSTDLWILKGNLDGVPVQLGEKQ